MKWPGLPRPTACTSRFSQPPGAFIRPEPAGPVSCRIRSWGSALQSFPPLVQPYAVSDAVTLLALPEDHVGAPSTGAANPKKRRLPASKRHPDRPARLQGLAPHESPPHTHGCLGREQRVALLGFRPPGCSPSLDWHGFHRASPHGLGSTARTRPEELPFRVSHPARSARLPRDRLPSWASPPHDHHEHSIRTRLGSHLLRLRGASPSPASHL
jgi:hypothetical protein